jgi:hypothetical protein
MAMKNSPMTFQRLIDDALEGIKGQFCYGYLDDIIVFSENWNDHLVHVAEVMKRLAQRRLRVSLGKCRWGVEQVTFLGFIFRQGQMATDPEKIEAVKKIEYPNPDPKEQAKGVKRIQCFLGMTGFLRRFIKGYAEIVKPLYSLLKKDTQWCFNKEHKEAWDTLKKRLIEAFVLIDTAKLG